MNKISIIIFAVALAVAVLVGINYYVQPLFGANAFEDVSGVNAQDFNTYSDELGFEIEYPASFKAVKASDSFNPVRVGFAASSEGSAEVVEIAIATDSVETLKSDLISALSSTERQTLRQGTAFGKASVVSFETQIAGESVYARQAYFECSAYNAILTALVPASFNQDLKAVNYMVSTFECS